MQGELTMAGANPKARRLARALEREMEMRSGDAREIAALVLSAFEGQAEVHDDELPPDLRSVFYELEQHRLLSFRREEYRNEEGHIRRAFYWSIRWDDIAPSPADEEETETSEGTVYDELPQKAWARP